LKVSDLTLLTDDQKVFEFTKESISPYNLLRIVLRAKFSEPLEPEFFANERINGLIEFLLPEVRKQYPEATNSGITYEPRHSLTRDIGDIVASNPWLKEQRINLSEEELRVMIHSYFYPHELSDAGCESILKKLRK